MMWIIFFWTVTATAAEVLDKRPVFLHNDLPQFYNGFANGILGWRTIAEIDINKGDDCPVSWKRVTVNDVNMCRVPSDNPGCYAVTFPINGQSYMEIVGALRGYQKGSPDGFGQNMNSGNVGINGEYVDGVSITLGMPRKHVWTYAVGVSIDYNYNTNNCPCSVARFALRGKIDRLADIRYWRPACSI